MNWFYVADNEQKGPVEQGEFDRLIQTGVITPATLVWHEGLADWQPQGALVAAPPALPPIESNRPGVICSECGRAFGLDQTIRLGNGYVCADCKGVAMQKLREGVTNNTSEQIRREHLKHEASVQSIAVLYFLAGAFVIVFGSLSAVGTAGRGGVGTIMGAFFVLLGVGQIWVGIGLRRLKSWARIPTGILSGFGLLGFPIGTLINAYILYLIFSKKGKTVFSDDYKRVIEETPHIKYKTSIVVWIFLGLLILLIGLGVLGFVMSGWK